MTEQPRKSNPWESQGLWQSKGFIEVPFSKRNERSYFSIYSPDHKYWRQAQEVLLKNTRLCFLTGAKACGKTELGRQLVMRLDRKYWFCAVKASSGTTPLNLIKACTNAFALPYTLTRKSRTQQLEVLLDRLQAKQPQKFVVMIDDAHQLPEESIDCLNELLELQERRDPSNTIVSIVLTGPQSWSRSMMQTFKSRGHKQVDIVTMQPLSLAETRNYLLVRLKEAGWKSQSLPISPQLVQKVYQETYGYISSIEGQASRILLPELIRAPGIWRQRVAQIGEVPSSIIQLPIIKTSVFAGAFTFMAMTAVANESIFLKSMQDFAIIADANHVDTPKNVNILEYAKLARKDMLSVQTVSMPSAQPQQNFGSLKRQIHLIKQGIAPQKAPRPTHSILTEQPKAFRVAATALPRVGLDIAKMLDSDHAYSPSQPQAVLTASKPSTNAIATPPSAGRAQPSPQQLKVTAQPAPSQTPSVATLPRQNRHEYDNLLQKISNEVGLYALCIGESNKLFSQNFLSFEEQQAIRTGFALNQLSKMRNQNGKEVVCFADSLKQSNLSGSPMGIRLGASPDQYTMQVYANGFSHKNGLEVQVKSSRKGVWIAYVPNRFNDQGINLSALRLLQQSKSLQTFIQLEDIG